MLPEAWLRKGLQQADQHREPSSEVAAHTLCDAHPQLQSLAEHNLCSCRMDPLLGLFVLDKLSGSHVEACLWVHACRTGVPR